jgi:predicted transglutaminase-like cysteine proteinase
MTWAVAVVFTVLGLSSAEAFNNNGASIFMPVGTTTSQPIGHYEFCQRMPGECSLHTLRPQLVTLTNELWSELTAVNDAVNGRIHPMSDQDVFGQPEVWSFATNLGDCEDYVLVKRRELASRGWPLSALLVTVVRQENGDGHAVLTVVTDRGDFVLDNLDGRVRLWTETPYLFVKRQSERDTGAWISVGDDRSILVGAVNN